MITKSLIGAFALAYWAFFPVFAEESKSTPTGTVLTLGATSVDHVTIDTEAEGKVVYTAHSGYAIEKVLDGDKTVKAFNLSDQAPKSVTKYEKEGKHYLTIAVVPAHHLTFKKDGDNWVEWKLAEFYKTVLFKGREEVVGDVNKHEDTSLFGSEVFGDGKKHAFNAPNKRITKVTHGDKVLLKGEKEVFLGLTVYAHGDKKVATVWYIYVPDDRIKEIFFEKSGDSWVRVKTEAAAKVLNSINSKFSADYKTQYDGFSISGVLFSIAAICVIALYY